MSLNAAVYVIRHDLHGAEVVHLALETLRRSVARLIVVVPQGRFDAAAVALSSIDYDRIIVADSEDMSYLEGLHLGLMALRPAIATFDSVIVTGADVFGPLFGLPELARKPAEAGAALFSCYWSDLRATHAPERVASLDFAAFDRSLLAQDWFWGWVGSLARPRRRFSGARDTTPGAVTLSRLLAAQGCKIVYPVAEDVFETIDPRLMEVHKLVENRCPVIPCELFHIDPIRHDLNAIYLRHALDLLHQSAPVFYRAIMKHSLRRTPLREFTTVAEEYEVIPEVARSPGKTEWSFGKVAVFIHAFYANMMPQFWALLQSIPCDYDVFITTSSAVDKARIDSFLENRGLPESRRDVRVAAQNRGRDMSSLFITFRDVVLEDRYALALRLHSKRTPQVSRQVGESFKDHLFENLVASPDHVRNILDMFEEHPDIGLVIPPVIHIGFATLGHSWFDNKEGLRRQLGEMKIDVPLDQHTPVAPYGTMYWFRPKALQDMFAWPWRWEDYNAEPNHTDGGLAHVQERMIAYVAQARGYRTVSVMTPRNAARYYAKLEYKLALVASLLTSGNIHAQRIELQGKFSPVRSKLHHMLEMRYARFLARHPAARRFISPLVRPIGALLRR